MLEHAGSLIGQIGGAVHIILGGTGQVGSAVARSLLKLREPVTVVTRTLARAADLKRCGAEIAVGDIRDVARLREIFRSGTRAFLLNPPADPSGDTDTEERANVAAILDALDGSGLEKVVAASTYGARPGERCGDLTGLYEFEERLRAQPVPAAVNRGAYYMSNWTGLIDAVRESGILPSFLPEDLAIPTVAPDDLGEAAAARLMEPIGDTGTWHVEGPQRYSPRDVAVALADALEKPVQVAVVPRDMWEATFRQIGFSEAAAASYACMTSAVVDGQVKAPDNPLRGSTTLRAYLAWALALAG